MTQHHDERGAELRDLFYETSQELLQALNDEALRLEKHPGDEEIVRSIRRTVHTLKGDSAAVGLRELSELAHQFEDALSVEGAVAHAAVAEIAFAAADLFTEMIAAYRKGGKVPSTKKLSKKIEELTATPAAKKSRGNKKGAAKAKAPVKSAADWTEYEKLAMTQAQSSGQDVLHVVVKIDPHCAMPIAGRQLIQNAVSTMGPVLAVRPDAKSAAAARQVEFVLATVQTAEEIIAKCKIPTIAEEVAVDVLYQGAAAGAQIPAVPAALAIAAEQSAEQAAEEQGTAHPAAQASGAGTQSPARQAFSIWDMPSGSTLQVTEIQPCPPCAM